MGNKQHDPDKQRVFVRALEGAYSLKDELGRLRSMPRVIKGKDLKLDGGPQHFSRHYVEPRTAAPRRYTFFSRNMLREQRLRSTAM